MLNILASTEFFSFHPVIKVLVITSNFNFKVIFTYWNSSLDDVERTRDISFWHVGRSAANLGTLPDPLDPRLRQPLITRGRSGKRCYSAVREANSKMRLTGFKVVACSIALGLRVGLHFASFQDL